MNDNEKCYNCGVEGKLGAFISLSTKEGKKDVFCCDGCYHD